MAAQNKNKNGGREGGGTNPSTEVLEWQRIVWNSLGGSGGLRRKRKGWQNWLLKARKAEEEGRRTWRRPPPHSSSKDPG